MSPKKKKQQSKKQNQKLTGSSSDGKGNDDRKSRPIDLEELPKDNNDNDNDDSNTSNSLSDDDSDENDSELLAAAAAWADKEDHNTHAKNDPKPSSAKTSTTFSTHITQLPYDTNELDLRRLFAEHGCAVSSIRLVYDRDEHGRKTVFRGVAFVDFSNAASSERALALNRKSSIRGRKLNIRPTRSKQELADIVSRTRELVQEKIKVQKEKGDGETKPATSTTTNKKKDKKDKKKKAKKEKVKVAKAESKKAVKHPKPILSKDNGDGKEVERKLTKKERNRRAAIIMGMGMKRKRN